MTIAGCRTRKIREARWARSARRLDRGKVRGTDAPRPLRP